MKTAALATSLGLALKVANCCHEAWKWRKVKRKTDEDDALKLATMALNDEARGDEQVKLLQTVPGVGTRLAETVVNCLDDPHRFASAAEVSSYAGLVPKQRRAKR